MVGRHQKRSAIGIEGEARLVRVLLQRQRDQICDRTLIAVMGPDETLSTRRTQGWKSLPVPRGRTDGAFELLPDSSEVGSGHGRVQMLMLSAAIQTCGTACPFTLARMNLTISSMAVPGWKTAATPAFLSAPISWSGIMPPTSTRTSAILFCLRRSRTHGAMALWAPERIESPITCTSSCSDAFTIISGVCLRPV